MDDSEQQCQHLDRLESHVDDKLKEASTNNSNGVDIGAWRALLARRNLSSTFAKEASSLEIEQALQRLSEIKLDGEQISRLVPAYFLYLPVLLKLDLQNNNLTSLKGVLEARQLRSLNISRNEITSLEGLKRMQKLTFLDASENKIGHLDPERDLPTSLCYLDIAGNPCSENQTHLIRELLELLPELRELDSIPIANPAKDQEASSDSSDAED